ncbi:hypothetical protein BSZ05_22720 [Vibrio mediterranei]|uniref:Uncharacterized protein n=2 Tax=Vibrio mediterranei TaxID=689 RepID=A0AAN1FNL7_9VIBR|nr:hypothetical protein BSZ05_22720 [Vibrio mediterranei]
MRSLYKEPVVIVCNSIVSFFDMCDNDLVFGRNVHCVFNASEEDKSLMWFLFEKRGGFKLSFSLLLAD